MNDQEDRSKPISIDEIKGEEQPPKRKHFGFPIAVGDTGFSLGKAKYYPREDTEDVPDGGTIGARIK